MTFPQRPIVVLSLAAAYATSVYARQQGQGTPTASSVTSVTSAKGFLWAFAVAYLVQAVAYGVYAIFLYPRLVSPLRHLPQVTKGNHWLYGQFARIIREASGKPALEWINSIPNDGLIRYLGMFNHERLLITKPKALAEVLVTRNYDYEKPRMVRDTLERLLGVGLLLAEGDEHKFQRKHLSPAFAFRHVKDLYPVFWDKGRESVLALEAGIQAQTEAETDIEKKEKTDKRGAFEINSWASRTTLDIIGIAGLGRDFGAIQDPDNKLAAQYHLMLNPDSSVRIMHFLALIFPRWLLDMLPLRRNANIESANVYIKKMCRNLVAEKRLLMETKAETKENKDKKDEKELDILSVAMESGGFTDENLASQLMTFLAAGHETTSAALTWAIYQLCIHTDMQDRLRAEIREHLPSLSEAGAPSPADIDQLPYLNAVCSEVLRYMAPVPSTVREARVDTVIQGQHVPRGTLVMLVPWAVNRSVELWGPTATQFDPARWLSGATPPTASNYSFLSFLHGPRSCIGMGFARAEFACVLAAWVGRFEFRIQDPVDLDEDKLEILGNVSSRPKKGMHVYARIVDGW